MNRLNAGAFALCAILAFSTVSGCKKDPFKSPERLFLLKAAQNAAGQPLTAPGPEGVPWPVVEMMADDDALKQAASDVLQKTFAAEAVTLLLRTKAYLRTRIPDDDARAQIEGAVARSASAIVVGGPPGVPRKGLLLRERGSDGVGKPVASVLWVAMPAGEAQTANGVLEQCLAGRVGRLVLGAMLQGAVQRASPRNLATLVGGPWLVSDPLSALVDGYGLHVETLARKFSTSGQLSAASDVDGATDAASVRVAAIAQNRYAFRPPDPDELPKTPKALTDWIAQWAQSKPPATGSPWRGAQMVAVPGVVASAIGRLAEDPVVALAVPPAAFFAPFHDGKLPDGFDAKKLSTFQVAHLKLLHAAFERLSGKDAVRLPGVQTLVEAYGIAFPAEREAAIKALMSATYARTADTSTATGFEANSNALRVTGEVLAGSRYLDGAVGRTLLVRVASVAMTPPGGSPVPLIFNLNAALPWQLAILPGMTAEATTRVYERIEKAPIATLEDLSGKIPAETFAVLELVQLP